jgi:hypothetical protein
MLLAIGGINLGHWSTHEWEAHHKEPPPNKAEDLSNKTEPKTVAPETKPIEPYVPKVRLIFKDSPLLTPPRREHINKTIDALYVYLTGLGFTMEREFPPIGVSSDNVFKGGGTYPGTIYDKGFLLPKNRIEDETLIRWMYAREIFTVLLCAPQESTIFRLEAEPIFTGYYVSSFKGDVHSLAKNTWINKLWAVRQAKGKDFTDRALFYTYRTWRDPTANEKDFDTFLSMRFIFGTQVISNDFDETKEVSKILAAN